VNAITIEPPQTRNAVAPAADGRNLAPAPASALALSCLASASTAVSAPAFPGPSVAGKLRRGVAVSLVPGGPHGAGLVASLLEAMSPEARRLRFFQAMPVVPAHVVRRMCDVDHDTYQQWLALVDGEAIGEVSVARIEGDLSRGEVALAVRDDWRRRGVGRMLLEVAGELATHRGMAGLTCEVQTENRASVTLFRSMGFRFRFADGCLAGVGPCPTWTGEPQARPMLQRLADDARSDALLAQAA
jgi:GNAT superfamily N-acetyltransferase